MEITDHNKRDCWRWKQIGSIQRTMAGQESYWYWLASCSLFFAAHPDFKISKSLLLLSEQCPWSCLTNIFLFSACSNLRFLVSVSFHKQPLFSKRYIFFCCSWQKLTTNSLTIVALQLYVVVMSLQTISKCFSVHILAKLNNWGPMQAIVSVLPLHPNQVVVWVFLRHLWTESRTNDYWQVNLSIEPMNP